MWGWPWLWAALPALSPAVDTYYLLRPLAFVLAVTLFEAVAAEPLAVYSTFVIEERFGFNNHTAWSYAKDQAIGLTVAQRPRRSAHTWPHSCAQTGNCRRLATFCCFRLLFATFADFWPFFVAFDNHFWPL